MAVDGALRPIAQSDRRAYCQPKAIGGVSINVKCVVTADARFGKIIIQSFNSVLRR